MLFVESGITPEVAAERGYYTLPNQKNPVLGIPVRSPDGKTTYLRKRPSKPRIGRKQKNGKWVSSGKPVKYEQPTGQEIILDVHPRNVEKIKCLSIPLWITEGEKKADCLTSRGLCTISLQGVWCWGKKPKKNKKPEMLPCWDHVALKGRRVCVVYDSDVMVKLEVQLALEGLVEALEGRGAIVEVVYLPDAEDGSSQGVDDYLVAGGGTVEKLHEMAQPFEKKSYVGERLSRNQQLRAQIEAAWKIYDALPLRTNKDYTRKAIRRVMVEVAQENGKPVKEGPEFFLSTYDWAVRAGVSQPTVSNHLRAMEEEGSLLVQPPDDPTLANTYVLITPTDNAGAGGNHTGEGDAGGRASGNHNGPSGAEKRTLAGEEEKRGEVGEGERGDIIGEASQRDYQMRAGAEKDMPELLWSRTVKSWRVDANGVRHCEADSQKRLGKRNGAILYYVVDCGGEGEDLEELTRRFGSETMRPRDFKRRCLSEMDGSDGGPRMIDIGEDNRVRAVGDWRQGLERARTIGEEQKAHDDKVEDYKLKREAFRQRHSIKPDCAPTEEEIRERREKREEVARECGVEAPEPPEEESQPAPVPGEVAEPETPDLYGLLNKPVRTTRGTGILWQAFPASNQLGVLLDSNPGVVTYIEVSEFIGPEATTAEGETAA